MVIIVESVALILVMPDSIIIAVFSSRCAPGFHDDGGTCVPNCVPNPCFQNAVCQIDNGSVVCDCEPIKPWYGQFCSLYPQESDSDPVVGMATATIAAIVVAVILVLGK